MMTNSTNVVVKINLEKDKRQMTTLLKLYMTIDLF